MPRDGGGREAGIAVNHGTEIPLDVAWQIATSFDRLLLQLWPTFVWGAFQLTGRERLLPIDVSGKSRPTGATNLRPRSG